MVHVIHERHLIFSIKSLDCANPSRVNKCNIGTIVADKEQSNFSGKAQ